MEDTLLSPAETFTVASLPSWAMMLVNYLGLPIGAAIIIVIIIVLGKVMFNMYRVSDARSDGSVSSFEQLLKILENRDQEIMRLSEQLNLANERMNAAYRERNEAVSTMASQAMKIEFLVSQIETLQERIKVLELQLGGRDD